MHVCVSPDEFLPRFKALFPLVGSHFPNPVLQTVQLESTEDGRGVLRATNLEVGAEVEVPLLKVIRPGVVQLPPGPLLRAIENATAKTEVEIEEVLPDTLPFMADPRIPSRKVVVRTPQGSVTIPTWDAKHFPTPRPAEFTESVEIAARKFRELLKALVAVIETRDDANLTLGFTAAIPWRKFQVQGSGFTAVASLIRDGRADRPERTMTQQEPTQGTPPRDEADSLRSHSLTRTSIMPRKSNDGRNGAPAQNRDKPVRVIRLRNIRGNIWANRLPSGQVAYNVTIDRLWREDDQVNGGGEVIRKGEWHQSQSLGRDDLLLVAKVADLCHTWIFRRIQEQSREQSF